MTLRASALILLASAAPAAAEAFLSLPLDCTLGQDCYIEDYHDAEPGEGQRDYTCGIKSRDGHRGTDFAAPRGTPVMAAGAGIVERANRFGSFGNYVRIRHANGYQTAYAHLQGFASGVRAGTRVQQGQIIAYVGTTGRSTGPHLHYEVHLNGNPTNPMSLDLPTGRRLEADELDDFTRARDELLQIRDNAPPALDVREDGGAILTADNAGDA